MNIILTLTFLHIKMIHFKINDINSNENKLIESHIYVNHSKQDKKLTSIFTRQFNERNYKQNKFNIFKNSCIQNGFQLITDYNFEQNKDIDLTIHNFIFLLFDYKKFYNIINSLESVVRLSINEIIDHSYFYLVIDFENIFDAMNEIGFNICDITFTKYELFMKKVMIQFNLDYSNNGYYIDRNLFGILEIYNYIYNHAYELVNNLSKKYPITKIFDIINNQTDEDAKELNKLLSTFEKFKRIF